MNQDATAKLLAVLLEHFPTMPLGIGEYEFCPERSWRLDRAWPEVKLGVEIHGSVWSGGRHVTGRGFVGDREKINEAIERGWVVLEYTTTCLSERPEEIAGQFATVYGDRM